MVAASAALFVYFSSFCQRAAEDVLRWMAGAVSGDEHRFRCCTVGELLRDWDCVSVIAVREKCDKKGLRADKGHRSVRCRQLGRAPFGYPSRLRSGLRQNRAGFLEKREKGRTPPKFRVGMLEVDPKPVIMRNNGDRVGIDDTKTRKSGRETLSTVGIPHSSPNRGWMGHP